MTQDLPPRATDIFRHLSDLRSGSYEGARQWPDRVAVFRRAVGLLDPVVRRILEQANADFLRGSGTIRQRAELMPKRQNWCRSAQSWAMNLEHIPRFDRV